jgi:hypothetical protein
VLPAPETVVGIISRFSAAGTSSSPSSMVCSFGLDAASVLAMIAILFTIKLASNLAKIRSVHVAFLKTKRFHQQARSPRVGCIACC